MGLPLINWSFWEQKNDVIYFVTQTKNNPGGSYFDQRHPKWATFILHENHIFLHPFLKNSISFPAALKFEKLILSLAPSVLK